MYVHYLATLSSPLSAPCRKDKIRRGRGGGPIVKLRGSNATDPAVKRLGKTGEGGIGKEALGKECVAGRESERREREAHVFV